MRRPYWMGLGVAVLAAGLLAAGHGVATGQTLTLPMPPAPPGAGPAGPELDDGLQTGDTVSINFDNADLREVINTMSRLTGENFLIDPSIKGTVTIIAPRRVAKDRAFEVLQSILELHGFALVPGENAYKVVQARTATAKDIPVCVGRESCPGYTSDQLVTQLIPLRYADARSLQGTLTSLVSRDANMQAYENTNTIIMTDSAANIRRILEIVKQVDVSGFEENVTIVPLKHSNADQLAQTLREAMEGGDGAAPTRRPRRAGQPPEPGIAGQPSEVRIIPESRTNSLIIVANEIDTQQVMFLVRQLDTQTPVEQNNIHVHRLSNALAPELAEVLSNLAGAAPAAGSGDGGAAPDRLRTFYQEVSVVADESTNSLLLIASPQDYAVMSSVIEKLDVRRPQVMVEVLIADVSLDFAQDLGIRWATGIGSGNDGGFVGVNETIPGTAPTSVLGNLLGAAAPIDLTNPNIGTLAAGLPGALPAGGSIGALAFDMGVLRLYIEANANESNGDFDLLSSPNLLMLDNEEARIVIAENVPFVTGTLTDTGGAGGLAQNETFEFRDVGITLEVTPHIAPDRTVRLELHQEVNEVGPRVTVGQSSTLTEVKREITTVVLVNDRHTIVIGGLITENDRESTSRVPVLGDIPVLGWLFKNKNRTISKTNLMVFITPTIVASLDESERITHIKKGELPAKMNDRIANSGTYQRSETFRRPPTNMGDAPMPEPTALRDAPVK